MALIRITNTSQGIETQSYCRRAQATTFFPPYLLGPTTSSLRRRDSASEKRTGLAVDANAAVAQNITLQLAQRDGGGHRHRHRRTDTEVHVETASTQMGDVVSAKDDDRKWG